MVTVSVVVPTYRQWSRTALVLESLLQQLSRLQMCEILVVDDASEDGTQEWLKPYCERGCRVITQASNTGLHASRNRGISEATGELVVILDGDALPGPELVSAYCEAYVASQGKSILCGRHMSLADTEWLRDPATGETFAHAPVEARAQAAKNRQELSIDFIQDEIDFSRVESRAVLGGYPTHEAGLLQQQIAKDAESCPEPLAMCVALFPHNCAIPSRCFRDCGSFDERISCLEGWEFALRALSTGYRTAYVDAAVSYHLYHHRSFGSSAQRGTASFARHEAIEYIARKHHRPEFRLTHLWLATLWNYPMIPDGAMINSVEALSCEMAKCISDRLVLKDSMIVIQNHPMLRSVQT